MTLSVSLSLSLCFSMLVYYRMNTRYSQYLSLPILYLSLFLFHHLFLSPSFLKKIIFLPTPLLLLTYSFSFFLYFVLPSPFLFPLNYNESIHAGNPLFPFPVSYKHIRQFYSTIELFSLLGQTSCTRERRLKIVHQIWVYFERKWSIRYFSMRMLPFWLPFFDMKKKNKKGDLNTSGKFHYLEYL